MICPTCGEQVPETRTCLNCGSPLVAEGGLAGARDGGAGQQRVRASGDGVAGQEREERGDGAAPGDGNARQPYVRASDDGYWETTIFEVRSANPEKPEVELFDPFIESRRLQDDAASESPLPGAATDTVAASASAGMDVGSAGADAGSVEAGASSPRKAPLSVPAAIGIVVGVVAVVVLVSFGMVCKQVLDTVEENGWDINQVQIIRGADGTIVVREHEGAVGGSTPIGILTGSSGADPAEGSSQSATSDATAGAGSAASGSLASAGSAAAFDARCLDEFGNPTLYALVELDGADLQALLQSDGFGWYDEIAAWMRGNSTIFEAVGGAGNVSKDVIGTFGRGAQGVAAMYVLSVAGYETPGEALDGLGQDVGIAGSREDGDTVFALVSGSDGAQCLALVTATGSTEQTVLLYGQEAIGAGLFRDTIGIDVGSTVAEAWDAVTG